jgi:hypothetical protein
MRIFIGGGSNPLEKIYPCHKESDKNKGDFLNTNYLDALLHISSSHFPSGVHRTPGNTAYNFSPYWVSIVSFFTPFSE